MASLLADLLGFETAVETVFRREHGTVELLVYAVVVEMDEQKDVEKAA